jgi:hypothetical protein
VNNLYSLFRAFASWQVVDEASRNNGLFVRLSTIENDGDGLDDGNQRDSMMRKIRIFRANEKMYAAVIIYSLVK